MSKTKEETKKEEIEKLVEKEKVPARKYRYYCDACTGIAFYSEEITVGARGNCQVCGKPYVARKENFIKL